MTTPLFLLRCVQLGLSMSDLELLSIGLINDMYCESRNDSCSYAVLGTQEDMDLFYCQSKLNYPHLFCIHIVSQNCRKSTNIDEKVWIFFML